MSDRCNKYESLFIFGSEDDLRKHISQCPDCMIEHQEMEKVSNLVKEVKPFIRRKKFFQNSLIRIAACMVIVLLGAVTINQYSGLNVSNQEPEKSLIRENSVIAQIGLPTDEYGLLEIE